MDMVVTDMAKTSNDQPILQRLTIVGSTQLLKARASRQYKAMKI